MRDKYATVKIPIELASKLDELSEDLGYRSRAEIVKDAVRRFIENQSKVSKNASPAEKRLEQAPQLATA